MAENMNMEMNNNMNYGMNGQYTQAPQKKSSGGGLAWLVFLVVGIILLVLGVLLYNGRDKDKYFKTKDMHETFSSESISRIELDIPYADITIAKSTDKMIHIDAENVPEMFVAKTEGSTFKTLCKKRKIGIITIPRLNFWDDSENAVIKVALPEKEYSSFILDLGAGETTASDIKCGSFKLDCGAGDITFTNVKCSAADIDCGAGQLNITGMDCKEKLEIDGGAGEINVLSSTVGGLDLDQGVGKFEFSGTINGNINADGGVGEMIFRLTNPETDFSKNGGKYKMDIDHGVGSVDVYYNE
ncbi:DUF4097 family beta strand repeat-containing protein [Ruminococcus flavefaciens]|uniref:Putative adhesin n=1 Tax=Ruminococcus flavefaciens TaxID=1265 RepID=A0A1M7MQ71_RUMFL|nr:DUF4097 family beta strand repeat-containing protein [Ruminococcus flavefaciens]SHM93164.1 Putative adhesin [Ruminococcus flavefaciens]